MLNQSAVNQFFLKRESMYVIITWCWVFQTSFNWWTFIRMWVTPNLISRTEYFSPYQKSCGSIISILPPVSNSSTILSKTLKTFPSAPITIGIIITMFQFLSNFLLSFIFILWSVETTKSTRWQFLYRYVTLCLKVWLCYDNLFVCHNLLEVRH